MHALGGLLHAAGLPHELQECAARPACMQMQAPLRNTRVITAVTWGGGCRGPAGGLGGFSLARPPIDPTPLGAPAGDAALDVVSPLITRPNHGFHKLKPSSAADLFFIRTASGVHALRCAPVALPPKAHRNNSASRRRHPGALPCPDAWQYYIYHHLKSMISSDRGHSSARLAVTRWQRSR